jgi:hypothetical protein
MWGPHILIATCVVSAAACLTAEWGGRRVVCQVGTVWTLPWTWDALCRLGPVLSAVMATPVRTGIQT